MLFASIIAALVAGALAHERFNTWLVEQTGAPPHDGRVLLLHLCLILLVGLELGRLAARASVFKISPARLFVLSFAVLVMIGGALLMLPQMSHTRGGLPFVDALFTATSAACVTGLSVVDTASALSVKGQIVILALIQLGGLNIVLFAHGQEHTRDGAPRGAHCPRHRGHWYDLHLRHGAE